MARGLKFRIQKVEGLYYLCSENKGADQLRGYREADLRLCFRICKKPVFSRRGSNCNCEVMGLLKKSNIAEQFNFLDLEKVIRNASASLEYLKKIIAT